MNQTMKPNKSSPAYLKQKTSGGLFVGFLYVLVFMSILALGIWQNIESKSNKETLNSINERLIVIEEQINIADEINNDSLYFFYYSDPKVFLPLYQETEWMLIYQ